VRLLSFYPNLKPITLGNIKISLGIANMWEDFDGHTPLSV
jgi:hypothetical protein